MTDAPNSAPVRVRLFGKTDVGMQREHNEDNYLVADLSAKERGVRPEMRERDVAAGGMVFAVCDGMGGAAAGEVASQLAVDTVYELMLDGGNAPNRDEFARRLTHSVMEAGQRIYLSAKSNRAQRGMGTTSTVAGIYGTTLFLGQVGDSRAYYVRNGRIKQITKDQSLVAKLMETGQLTEQEAESYEHSHIILQALGTSDSVSVDLSFMDVRHGDALLLCSDGLSGLVHAEQMREVLVGTAEPADCCKQLIDLANAAGGHDNVTVIVVRFEGGAPQPGPDDEVFGYQPYVLPEPVDRKLGADTPATVKIKRADAPPPGSDVKNAASVNPPPVPGLDSASSHDDGDELVPPTSGPSTFVVGIVLGVLAIVAMVFAWNQWRTSDPSSRGTGAAAAPSSASAPAPTADAAPAPAAPAPETQMPALGATTTDGSAH